MLDDHGDYRGPVDNGAVRPDWLRFDPFSNTLTIDGIRFAREIFTHFAHGLTQKYFRIVGREHGTVTIEQTEDYVLNATPEMLVALCTIADIAEGSTSANSLPHIAKIARAALAKAAAPDRSEPPHPQAKP